MAEKLARRVRTVVSKIESFTLHDLVEPMGIQTYAEKQKIKEAIKGLKRNGELITVTPGVFRYKPKQKPFSMLDKMWRGMRIKETFTWRDIVILSGADRTHVHKYIMFLTRAGYVERISKSRSYEKGVYRLSDPDHAPLEHPHFPAKRPKRRLK